MAISSFSSSSGLLLPLFFAGLLVSSVSANFYQNVEITWGDGRGQIKNNGELLILSLDKPSGSGFQSKNEYLFGKIDMQIKLVAGNSAGTVTAYYLKSPGTHGTRLISSSWAISVAIPTLSTLMSSLRAKATANSSSNCGSIRQPISTLTRFSGTLNVSYSLLMELR